MGRHAWRSLFESLDSLPSRVFGRQHSTYRATSSQPKRYPAPTHALRLRPQGLWAFPQPSPTRSYDARRSISTCGLLLAGSIPPVSCAAAGTAVAACRAVQHASPAGLAPQSWQRAMHTGRGRSLSRRALSRRRKSTKSSTEPVVKATAPPKKTAVQPEPTTGPKPNPETTNQPDQSEPGYLGGYFHLPHMPHLPHRPTKEELLAAANSFWERLKVHFKWASIRSNRPWNTDEWGAFLSFFLFGHLVWILVGTTTFVSLIILSINTVFAQGKFCTCALP